MGQEQSQIDGQPSGDGLPVGEHYLGLANFGNTCYANSVLQALYFCRPFRDKVLEYKKQQQTALDPGGPAKEKGGETDTLLSVLGDLFIQIATCKKKFGVIHPKKFITKVKKENIIFNNMQQQDAHEFLNYLLNTIADLLAAEQKAQGTPPGPTWIHDIFQGTLVNETKCLCCETVRSKDEDFLDLSVDVEQNTSLTYCLKEFSSSETLSTDSKYYCEECCSKQEATKRLRVKKLPQILAFHLKRFKFLEYTQRYTKLSHRVVFPWELKLFNTSDDAENADRMYDLIAVVVHCGSGPNRGHYITIIKSHGFWLLFDDDIMEEIEPHSIENFFGLTDSQRNSPNESGYILFYQSRDRE